ncbi:CLUMA_CG017354, isoform A [Clunio marinus]|uniref:CLUMA_CG017354, isoform A n=1 Tax=Clunio marinus TaxID=568069 RepID=A0A1J1IVL2_9DIPT|nr:CLUMA_CG017354, isoform A [Clunio marinus]
METPTTRPRNSPPPPPPKPKSKSLYNNNGSDHQQTLYEEQVNNNVENFYHQNNHNKSNGSNVNINNNNEDNLDQFYPSLPPKNEQVVMTPRGKTSNSTVILIERKLVEEVSDRVHVAGGDHQGIIINKDIVKDQKSAKVSPQLTLEFRVFLVSAKTEEHTQESRTLRFWFREWLTDGERKAQVAQDFFRELVSPKEFPRDYVGFIKKIMKLMQKGYNEIQSIEIELEILEQTSAPPSRPLSIGNEEFEVVPLTPEKVLELIEQAYPNPITPDDLARDNGWSEEEVLRIIISLQTRGLIKSMEFNSFTRIHHEDKEIKVVKQMPTIASNKQPTIAVITAQYCEKVAVDSMLENKETFVRYTTVGESNVYTLGNIGAHRIVSTKLPSIGSTREASIAAGNTCTRLLGTFQKVDYVFIVGVAGGIPHYTDYKKHVRLGDVVISSIDQSRQQFVNGDAHKTEKPYCYVYSNGEEFKTYFPVNSCLQEIAKSLQTHAEAKRPWEAYYDEGILHLKDRIENDFTRPSPNTDKLYMNIGNRDVIEVQHPQPQDTTDANEYPTMRLHLGPVGSGYNLIKSDTLRTEFAKRHGLIATDVELNSVLDSIVGNCRDSFLVVKGISDYKDGTTTKKWQNYASLAAASVMKAIVCAMDAPTNV